ncbi:MAG TPA: trehalose-phosphatase [Burkholderiales bacterium]|nr:trehalose-phosphatase [Burkholderiales bacterium]
MNPHSTPFDAARSLPAPSPSWAFFLDIDGTLLELAERPDMVHVDAALVKLLGRLQQAAGGALALISGRSIADVDTLFTPLELAVAGQHGIERRDAAGRTHQHAFPRELLRAAAVRLHAFAAAHPGLLLEDKGHSLALHYRQAPQLADAARAEAAAAAAELGHEFELLAGKMVFELKPGGRDKGKVIEEYMQEAPFRGRAPVFVGDDLTDEYGFGVVNRMGGHAIKVGAGRSAARWRLADAQAVRAWLGDWVARFGPGAA